MINNQNEYVAELLSDIKKSGDENLKSYFQNFRIDFVLRCQKGLYDGRFLYINLSEDGEKIGSDPDQDLTLFAEKADLSPLHAEIHFNNLSKKYYLRNISDEEGTWIKVRQDYPLLIQPGMIIKIVGKNFRIEYAENPDILLEWLKRIGLLKLYDYFKKENLFDFKAIKEYFIKFDSFTLDLNQDELATFNAAYNDINEDFKDGFVNKRLLLIDCITNEVRSEVGWCDYFIGNELHEEYGFEIPEKISLDIAIKYYLGNFWLVINKYNTVDIFLNLNHELHSIQPDDVFKMGSLEFKVERFNVGSFESRGTRHEMEDRIVIFHDIHISLNYHASFYAVFDGHKGQDCVKYVSENLVETIRTNIIKNNGIDFQDSFKTFEEVLVKSFHETDLELHKEYREYINEGGCTACVVMIIGDIVFCANVGDSRAVLSRKGDAIALSIDHRATNLSEKERIEKAGGFIEMGRVNSNIEVTRAFGDFRFKANAVVSGSFKNDVLVSTPDIRFHKIDYSKDEFIIIGCDGLYDAYSNKSAISYARDKLTAMPLMEQDPQKVAEELVTNAVVLNKSKRAKSDNVSGIIINLTRGITK